MYTAVTPNSAPTETPTGGRPGGRGRPARSAAAAALKRRRSTKWTSRRWRRPAVASSATARVASTGPSWRHGDAPATSNEEIVTRAAPGRGSGRGVPRVRHSASVAGAGPDATVGPPPHAVRKRASRKSVAWLHLRWRTGRDLNMSQGTTDDRCESPPMSRSEHDEFRVACPFALRSCHPSHDRGASLPMRHIDPDPPGDP